MSNKREFPDTFIAGGWECMDVLTCYCAFSIPFEGIILSKILSFWITDTIKLNLELLLRAS